MFTRNKKENESPVVEPLARSERKFLFLFLIFIFVIAVPVFVFHAIGYRYDFFDPARSIVSTGALYVTVPVDTAQIYVNEQAVRDARVFRRASYIQYLIPGMHRVHVSAPDLHTWVKELPVYPHIVTEVDAFLLPVRPQLRIVSEYVNANTGSPVLDEVQFDFISQIATTSLPLEMFATSTKKSDTDSDTDIVKTDAQKLEINPEYAVLDDLFDTQASSSKSFVGKAIDTARQVFQFQTAETDNSLIEEQVNASTSIEIKTIKTKGPLTLFRRGSNIVVAYTGNIQDIPYYFCVPQAGIASTTEVYGAHVSQGITAVIAADIEDVVTETKNSNRVCRNEIRIDNQGADVYAFDFINVGSGAVILHREDGLFITEIDDRSWQNTQKIYGETAEALVLDNNRIYIKDEKDFYAEVFLTLIASNN